MAAGGDLPVGSLVELLGLPETLEAGDLLGTTDGSSLAPVSPNGQKGKVVGHDEDQLVVETFDAVTLKVSKEQVKEYRPAAATEGGFHFAWPAEDEEASADFAVGAVEHLMKDGYCVVQMSLSDEMKGRAFEEAQDMKYHRMKKEFEAAYLGREYKCKTAWLEELAEAKRGNLGALDLCDMHFSNFTKFMLPLAPCALNFIPYSRTNSMVRVPFQDAADEGKYTVDELDEEDIGDGLVDSHISFLKRKTLCMLNVLQSGGGELMLIPKDETKENVVIELAAGKMVVFRHDELSYVYNPTDKSDVVLQSWILQEPESLMFVGLAGDQLSKDEALGVNIGPNTPLGYRTNVFGMGLQLPGGAHGHADAYWAMVSHCADGIVKVPYSRYDMDLYSKSADDWLPGTTYAIHSGFLCQDIYALDNECFGIPEDEAYLMAPAQRCILEKGYEALYKTGYKQGPQLQGRRLGIFCGHSGDDWSFSPVFGLGYEDRFRFGHGGRMWSTLTGRLAYVLGIRGPQSVVDTACSSALCAYGVGHTLMRKCEVDQVAVGMDTKIDEALMLGANLLPGPGGYISMCGPHMLSVLGRCFTFDHTADGFTRGEGNGGFVVKNESVMSEEAFATVIGACLNQDGRSASMTAPNGPSQSECIRGSMREAGLTANQVTCAECHGTGTALGDPIEVGALKAVMQERVVPIYQTSAKAHIGHLEAAAGMAGIVKCMMMCVAACGTPNCHLVELNPHLDVTGYPSIFPTELSDYGFNAGYSGVSSFGFGGANSRADVFASAKKGPHKTGELDWKKVDYVTVTCPYDLGPMHYLDGRCVPRATSRKYKHEQYRADAIRDEFASYDYNSSLYTGDYQLVARDADEEDPLPKGSIFIVGSWDQFKEAHEMEQDEDEENTWTFLVALGETRCERFHLRINNSEYECIYPIVQDGPMLARCMGPDEHGMGMHWLLDGRDAQVPAGTVYQVSFRWGDPAMIHWEQVEAPVPDIFLNCRHYYTVLGSWTGGLMEPMMSVGGKGEEENTWEAKMRIGMTGMEWFRLARDGSADQEIYPARSGSSEDVPVCGPDNLCNQRGWRITGNSGELVTIRVQVVDAHVTVTIISASSGTRVMHSNEGPQRHSYHIAGSFNDWRYEEMTLDEETLGTFRFRGTVGESGYEHFYITTDQDPALAYYPEAPSSYPGSAIVRGPAQMGEGKLFAISCLKPGAEFEIEFDRHADDKRRIVTVKWLDGRVDSLSMKAAFYNFRNMAIIPPGLMVDEPKAVAWE